MYGTDLGNSREVGISCSEVRAMQAAGMNGAEVVRAMTKAPADFFGLSALGSIEIGKRARLLLVEEDPESQAETLCKLSSVVSDRSS